MCSARLLINVKTDLPYFDNNKSQCWEHAALTAMAFSRSIRDYFNDLVAASSVEAHVQQWLISFDRAMAAGLCPRKSAQSKALFNELSSKRNPLRAFRTCSDVACAQRLLANSARASGRCRWAVSMTSRTSGIAPFRENCGRYKSHNGIRIVNALLVQILEVG
jgi:hypothetical protein